jgi:transcriptional regulator with XRE-family HTH domain
VAIEAAISPRHLSFVESGRSSPSREMVLTLAETLEVPLRERNALLGAAGFATVYPEGPLDSAGLARVSQAVSRLLEHQEPFPAVLLDQPRGAPAVRALRGSGLAAPRCWRDSARSQARPSPTWAAASYSFIRWSSARRGCACASSPW